MFIVHSSTLILVLVILWVCAETGYLGLIVGSLFFSIFLLKGCKMDRDTFETIFAVMVYGLLFCIVFSYVAPFIIEILGYLIKFIEKLKK